MAASEQSLPSGRMWQRPPKRTVDKCYCAAPWLLHARGLATVGGRARRGANPTEALSQLVDGTDRMHGMFMIAPMH